MHSNDLVGFTDGDTAILAEVVSEVEKTQAVIAAAQAAQTRALARAGEVARRQAARSHASVRVHDMALRGIAAEVAGVLRVTDRSVQRQIGDATTLVEDYPQTLDAWEAGAITRGHVRVIVEAGAPLPPEARPGFEGEALRRCEAETPGRVQGELRLLAERLHPRTLAERHVEARETRGVRVVPVGDGMSDLCATVPSLLADAIYDRLTQQARSIVDVRGQAAVDARAAAGGNEDADDTAAMSRLELVASDRRTMDQLRADLLTDMLLTSAPGADPTRTDDGPGTLGAIRAKVQVVVPVLTLLGRDDAPTDLVGHAPIDPATARELAGATRSPLERILTHPVTGAVLHVDTYQRTAAIDRYLRARDQHCRFPGCRLPAIRCEVDHTIDAAHGGPTDVRNLAHLCQRHHSMKQFTAWKVTQLPGGILHWTSPLGKDTLDHPPSLGVHFRPSDDPADTDNPPPNEPPQSAAPF
ncbi:HNH endonuclease signature motif containing protein [Microbacterium sp. SLBN-146]|uniref:HNH endonuclease signature motif containing protein n=1 Tax=Microbacterium sp. SLBN-146 TaxID=2768457 RepID=UPI0011507633|nr:HNH endonuclease signature motif containing protein [Microbacterium sp. SLBN-146]TQJ30688.1 HNH endonuclease [Microbacterium sp. SLBN-146]